MPPQTKYFDKMASPHRTGTNGQFNDEYDNRAFEKTKKRHFVPVRVAVDGWHSTPNVANLPSSCDDEMYDDNIFTTVDYSMVKNAAFNSLVALVKTTTFDSPSVTVSEENCVRPLQCVAQKYAWGKIGSNALVARLKAAQHEGEQVIDEESPYAELWIGTHPNGMSQVILPPLDGADGPDEAIPLVQYVQEDPEMHLGVPGVFEQSSDYDLTFLFKVLSINKVLSIQAHPDKTLAAQLYTDRPNVYKDPNHKPEMAVALTDDFEAMCGFRPIYEIVSNMLDYPEFTDLIGDMRYEILQFLSGRKGVNPRPVLQKLFETYMTTDNEVFERNLKALDERLAVKKDPTDLDDLIMRLSKQFPGDSGIFAPIIFNYLKLKTGDAFYIGANEPHAYIQGEILECMACSDNVVRAGLTPKLKDVDTLVKMLTYKCTMPQVTRGRKKDKNCTLYVPPIEDFAMEIIELAPGETYKLLDVRSPSVILTLNGSGVLKQGRVQTLPISFGKAAFMSANTTSDVTADRDGSGLKIVRALSNVHLEALRI